MAFKVGQVLLPENVGLFELVFKFNAVCVAVDTGFDRSSVLSPSPHPTIALVIPETEPVNVGLSKGAFRFN